MRTRKFTLCLVVLMSFALALNSCNLPTSTSRDSDCVVTAPPAGRFDPFYTKYCSARGIPILSSNEVPDLALQQAWIIIMNMTSKRADVVAELIRNDVRYAVIGVNQVTTDMPEYVPLATAPLSTDIPGFGTLTPKEYWDGRARGLGPTESLPLVSSGEENLLCYATDRYAGESITVHEFSHAILNLGMEKIDPEFSNRVQTAYQNAISIGLYDNTYANDNYNEYWAEGAQDYYNVNRESIPSDTIHNEINTNAELYAYDPALYELLQEVFPSSATAIGCPVTLPTAIVRPATETPLLLPTLAPVTAIATFVSTPNRCDHFSGKEFSLVTFDWQEGDPLTFYIKMSGGVPGLEIPISGDNEPWNYSANFGDAQTNECEFIQGYPERLYCTINLPSEYEGSAQNLEIHVNGCELPIYQKTNANVPAFPETDPDFDGDGYPASADCNDQNPLINPGAVELFNDNIDSNCDGKIDP